VYNGCLLPTLRRALADSPHLERLTWLRLRLHKLTDAGAVALLAWRPGTWAMLDVGHAGTSKERVQQVGAAGVVPW
jgi:hypothetical protein